MGSLQPTFTLNSIMLKFFSFLTLSHGIRLSFRQLKRILRNQGLFRRRNYSNPHEIETGIVIGNFVEVGVPLAID